MAQVTGTRILFIGIYLQCMYRMTEVKVVNAVIEIVKNKLLLQVLCLRCIIHMYEALAGKMFSPLLEMYLNSITHTAGILQLSTLHGNDIQTLRCPFLNPFRWIFMAH